MTTGREIALREGQTGLDAGNGAPAVRFALHELPIPEAAESLRRSLRIASHRLPVAPRDGNSYRTNAALSTVRRALRGWLERISDRA